jgi:glycerol uptake facilitator-like aquaporin
MVASLLKISGGQLNPAITAAMMITRNIGPVKGLIYIVAQVVGSIVGAVILYFVTPEAFRDPLGANRLNEGSVLNSFCEHFFSKFFTVDLQQLKRFVFFLNIEI